MWKIEQIESLGFELIVDEKLWCHFRGHGFDVMVNLDTNRCKGNLFNFKAYKNSFKGNFRARLNTEEEFKQLLKFMEK